jgi:hypothetical protein
VRPNREKGCAIEFAAYAFNSDRVKSDTVRKELTIPVLPLEYKEGAGFVQNVVSNVYLISVGVNTNEQPRWNLRFAANDARKIQSVLGDSLAAVRGGQKTATGEVVTVPLISDGPTRDATKSKIKAVFDLLAGRPIDSALKQQIPNADKLHKATPDDCIIFSISSHGFADESGVFYLVPWDAAAGDMDSMKSSCISSDELSLWLRDVDAGEVTLIIDACHSASAVEGSGFKAGPMGSRGLGQLAYDKGIRILAASQAADVALELERDKEGKSIEQGLLSYALIAEGIEKGRADFVSAGFPAGSPQFFKPDGQIELSEWLEYAVRRVPTLYQEVREGKRSLTFRGEPAKNEQSRSEIVGLIERNPSAQRPSLFNFIPGRQLLLAYTKSSGSGK